MQSHQPLNGTQITSLIALGLVAITGLVTIPPLLGATFGRGAEGVDPSQRIVTLIEKHDEQLQVYQDRFNGRSLFFRPPPPVREVIREDPPPREPDPPRDPQPTQPSGPPPPPITYTGPPPVAILGNSVMFKGRTARESGTWINVGDEKNGIKVIATNAPRSVTVGHMRGEYEVDVFAWDTPFFEDAAQAGQPIPGLIIPPDPPASRQRAEVASGRNTARPMSGSIDDEAMRQQAEQDGIELPEQALIEDEQDDQSELEDEFEPQIDPAPEWDPEDDPELDPESDDPEMDDTESDPESDPEHDPDADPESSEGDVDEDEDEDDDEDDEDPKAAETNGPASASSSPTK